MDAASNALPSNLVGRPELLRAEGVLGLQRFAGNTAVRDLLRFIQRDDDPRGFTSAKGIQDVEKSGTTRREVHDLTFGLKGGFAAKYKGKSTIDSQEGKMTFENPEHMAVVVMPDKLDKRPCQVILHFAGWGFRGGDPFAGYLVAKGGKRGKHDIAKGSVRDVDQEHWEQQIGELNREPTSGKQTIAILAQGRGMSDFGDVPTFDYIKDVFAHVPELSRVRQYSLIISGHSGGGGTEVGPKAKSGEVAQTRDRSKLPAAEKDKAAPQPTDMVILFDAEGTGKTTEWATKQIDALAASIKAAPADAEAAISATPRFRGYFVSKSRKGAYATAFTTMHKKLCDAIANVPAPWAVPDPANPKRVTAADLFRIVEMSGADVDHEHVISGGKGDTEATAKQGALADALRADADPTSDRAAGLPCVLPTAQKKPKVKARPRAKPNK